MDDNRTGVSMPASSIRPFSVNGFDRKVAAFQSYIDEVTLRYSMDPAEERRQQILGNLIKAKIKFKNKKKLKILTETLRFDQFCDRVRSIFGSEVKGSDLKSVFKKVTTNPDGAIDWSELFGYETAAMSAETADDDFSAKDEVQMFMVSSKYRVGEASGEKAKRDIIEAIYYSNDIDSYITASQKGAITVWNNKFKIQACTNLNVNFFSVILFFVNFWFLKHQIDGWTIGCCFMPNLKKIAVCSERSVNIWSFRTKKTSKPGPSLVNKIILKVFNKFSKD